MQSKKRPTTARRAPWLSTVRRCADSVFRSAVRRMPEGPGRFEPLEGRTLLAGTTPVITEFLALNDDGLQTIDGSRPDWIELHNPTASPVNLEGHFLTNTRGSNTEWRIPSLVLQPGAYAVVFASDRDVTVGPELHANFTLDAGGGYLALVAPDGVTVLSEYDFPQQAEDVSYGSNVSTQTDALVGPDATARVLVPASGGLGNAWHTFDFDDGKWIDGRTGVGFEPPRGLGAEAEPNDSTGAANDAGSSFNNHGGNLYHLGLKGTLGSSHDWFALGTLHAGDVVTITNSGAASSRGAAANPLVELHRGTSAAPVLVASSTSDGGPGTDELIYRLLITDTDAYYINTNNSGEVASPAYHLSVLLEDGGSPPATGGTVVNEVESNNNAAQATNVSTSWRKVQYEHKVTGQVSPGADGDYYRYTFNAGDLVTLHADSTGAADLRVALLNSAGTAIAVEDGSSAGLGVDSAVYGYVIATAGTYYVRVTGDGFGGGPYTLSTYLSANTAPPLAHSFDALIRTDIEAQMLGVNASAFVRVPFAVEDPAAYDTLRLRMKYDDGFAAYLNGVEVARRNAPADVQWNSAATAERPDAAALVYEDINLPPGALRAGDNVLAIHALNRTAGDLDSLVMPELQGVRTLGTDVRYFATPTPGAANVSGTFLGLVADTKYSHGAGYYTAPFAVTLTTDTPGATIRYTLDGSAPSATNGSTYAGPIPITGTTALRTMALKAGFQSTDVDTHTYIFFEDVIRQPANPAGFPNAWPAGSAAVPDYEMDTRVSLPEKYAVVMNGVLYFTASDAATGLELWRSDGTAAGTFMLKDIGLRSSGSAPGSLYAWNGKVYFHAAETGGGVTTGDELWVTDGTAAGTSMLKDLNTGGTGSLVNNSYPFGFTAVGSSLFFGAYDAVNGIELWKTDGTSLGTVLVKNINAGAAGSALRELTAVGGTLYFVAGDGTSNGVELWKSDGTDAGTVIVKNINPAGDSFPRHLTAVGSTLYFVATDGTSGYELWKSDGSDAGTSRVKDIMPGALTSRPTNLVALGSTLYFAASDSASTRGLWKTNGTDAGTTLVKYVNPGNTGTDLSNLTVMGTNLYFTASDGPSGVEIWKSDGTAAGTAVLKDIALAGNSSNPKDLTAVGSTLYFTATTPGSGTELWKTNGTAAGTVLAKEIAAGAVSSVPGDFIVNGSYAFFSAVDANGSVGLYKTDAAQGAVLVKALNVGRMNAFTFEDMTAIPTMSLVTSMNDMFGSGNLYSNPTASGLSTEKPGSLEMIRFDGRDGFQINAGVRMQGGASRSPGNISKHSFRMLFTERHGPSKLEYDLFDGWVEGDSAVDEFDTLTLRANFNNSWPWLRQDERLRTTYVHDTFLAASQLAMGQPGIHGMFVHLYVNGAYWGLYNPVERPAAPFAAAYNGGEKEEYDALNSNEAIDGDINAWRTLHSIVNGGAYNLAAPDPNAAAAPEKLLEVAQYLDVDNFIDYMMLNFYGGNQDWDDHNWYAARKREAGAGYQFYSWDAERILETPTGHDKTEVKQVERPSRIHNQLRANVEYRLAFADRVQKHMLNPGGALTPAETLARFKALARQIEDAVWGESARWGDGKRANQSYTQTLEWLNEVNKLTADDYNTATSSTDSYFSQRTNVLLNMLITDGLYVNKNAAGVAIATPQFSQHGGPVGPGFNLTITTPGGVASGRIYYTTDGTDPRLFGGTGGHRGDGSSATSIQYTGAFPLTASTVVKARFRADDGTWTALNEATFTANYSAIRVTELMFAPQPPPIGAGTLPENYEFVEIANTGPTPVNLTGFTFTNGIDYAFPAGTVIGAGQRLVIAQNEAAFTERYPGVSILGVYTGKLADEGERLTLSGPGGEIVQTFEYDDWYGHTRDGGFSIVPISTVGNYDSKANWRPSNRLHGNPGGVDSGITPGSVVINEALTHTDNATGDWIELRNTTNALIDISGWFLSDSKADLTKFRVPNGTVIPAFGTVAFTQTRHFGNPAVATTPFGLSEAGDDVYLSNNDGSNAAGGYREDVSFPAAVADETFGRYVKGTGGVDFAPLAAATFGVATNAAARVGPVVINELHYNPPAGTSEFIELKNLTASAIALATAGDPTKSWKLTGGVDFTFTGSALIPAFGYALVVPGDPAAFRAAYNIPANVPIFGPYTGSLDNAGEAVNLARPNPPELDGTVFHAVIDRVNYDDGSPWPIEPDGVGPSLARLNPNAYGNDAVNWAPGAVGGTPGRANGQEAPSVDAESPDAVIQQGDVFARGGIVNDPDPTQTFTGIVDYGEDLGSQNLPITNGTFSLNHQYAQPGTYDVLVTITDSTGLSTRQTIRVAVRPDPIVLGGGDDTYTIRRDPSGEFVQFFRNTSTAGAPTFHLPWLALNVPLSIAGGAGDDAVTVDFTHGSPLPTGGLFLTGGDGHDTLIVIADGSTAGARTITFLGGAGEDSVSFTGAAGPVAVNLVDGGAWVSGSGDAVLDLFGAVTQLGNVMLDGASRLNLPSGDQVVRATALVLAGSAVLNMADNDLVVSYAGPSIVSPLASYVRNAMLGSGPRIVGTPGANHPTTFGMVDNNLIRQAVWSGTPIASGGVFNQVILRHTYRGDNNLDGTVTEADYANVTANMGRANPQWFTGDLNYDGTVNADDFAEVTANLGAGVSPAGPQLLTTPTTPSPASTLLASSSKPKKIKPLPKVQLPAKAMGKKLAKARRR